jgi:hypothetical protein
MEISKEFDNSILQFKRSLALGISVLLLGASPVSAQLLACSVVSPESFQCFDVNAVGMGLHVNEVQFEINSVGPPPGITIPYQGDAAKVLITCPISSSNSVHNIRGRWYNVADWMPWSQYIPLTCLPNQGSGNCEEPGGQTPETSEECSDNTGSPILLDLDRNHFRLSGRGVEFDIDADGLKETVTWVRRGTRDGFLFLDRNGNGVVDGGSELFGDGTMLASGEKADNGYEALAEFDLANLGGNEDGVITKDDAIYDKLAVWVDTNANGIHDDNEVNSLNEVGVIELSLDYRESRRTDRHGNEFRYFSKGLVLVNGQPKRMATTDVFFRIIR